MRKIIIASLLFSLTTLILGQSSNSNYITVVGSAEKDIDPNWIVLTMKTKETESTKKDSEVVEAEIKITQFLESLGLDPELLTIDSYSASSGNLSSSSKFRLSKSYKLRINDVTKLDTIVDLCFRSGMKDVYVLEAGHTKVETYLDELLIEAAKSAHKKALLLAETLNCKLGAVYSIDERYQINRHSTSYDYLGEYTLDEVIVTGYGGTSRQRVGSTVGFRKIKLSKTVIVKYNIE